MLFSPVPDRLYGGPPEMLFSPVPDRLYGGPPEMLFSPVPDRLYGGPPEMLFSPVPDRLYGGPPEMVFSLVPNQINCGASEDGAITDDTIQSVDNNADDNSFNQTPIAESAKIVKILLEQHVYDKHFSVKEPCFQIIG
jgi:hypothetical protein